MRQASFLVTHELLRQLLHLPDDTEVQAIGQDYTDRVHTRFRVFISHPDLAEVTEGCAAPTINPVFEKDAEGNVSLREWGQEK